MRVLFFVLVIFISFVSAQTPFEKANQSANKGDYEQALVIYKQILSNAENEPPDEKILAKVHFNAGICHYHLNRANDAINSFEKAVTTSKGSYQKAFYALGMAHAALKNWRAAQTDFLNSLKLKKNDGEAWFDLGLAYLEEKNFEAAEKAFRGSIKYKSIASADAHNNLGVIFILKNDYISAEKEFETALRKSDGNSIEAKNNLQFCLFYKQNDGKDLTAKLEFSRRINNPGV